MDKQNEQADKPGPYVDIDALNKGDAKVIEKQRLIGQSLINVKGIKYGITFKNQFMTLL